MEIEKKEETPEEKPEIKEEEKTEEKPEGEKKDDFEKDTEVVSAGKYNQAVRKQREMELEKRELEKQLAEAKVAQPAKKDESDDEEEDDDFFKDNGEMKKSKSSDIDELVDAKVKPILERLNQKEEDERKVQRTAFFETYPQYADNAENWQELLDVMDENINPKSKASYIQQLIMAHRIRSGESKSDTAIDKKKRELASESSSKGDGAKKADDAKSSSDERAERLAKNMPIGYEAPKK